MRAVLVLALAACGGVITPRFAVDHVTYPNGKARFEFGLRDGVPNGPGRAWHANGKLASDGTYRDGARDGRFWLYNEDGTFAAQAVYVDNAEVWRSTDEREHPPKEWSKGMALSARPAASDAMFVDTGPEMAWEEDRKAPRPYFSTLDRTTAPARAGAQVGVGDAKDLDFGAATRLDVFGHYRIGRYGVFAQLSETHLALQNDMTLAGRRTAILAGTYHRALGAATLSTNAGFILPIGNVDAAGSVASYAGAEQRPADAASAIPAPFGVRSGASVTATRGPFLVQIDAGLDWLLGGDEHGFDAFGRANFGVGLGTHSTMLTAELDNALRLSDPHARLHTLALGGTLAFPMVWVSASLVFSYVGTTSFVGTVGRDL
ncbi:MAG: hypothetical protein JWO36_4079 [Myxococcales bacterium]|nr:hypothetical protein [Myxococcales bacterium]